MTNKRNKSLPCLMVMAAVLLSAFAVGGPQAMDYWTANAERSGVVYAGNGREAAVLCMQGRKVVMQVQVDPAAGFSYKARFFNVDPDLTKKGRVTADVGGDSSPAPQVNGRPVRCDFPSSVVFDGMLTLVYPESEGVVPVRTVYPSLRNPVIFDEWQLRNATDKPLTVDFSMPGEVKLATEKTLLVWTRQGPASTVVEPGGTLSMVLYGLSKFLLFQGDRAAAEEMWPLIEFAAASVLRHTTADGIVASETDEMEDRYPTGQANLQCVEGPSPFLPASRNSMTLGSGRPC
jgi:hypothetical protein